MRPLTLLIAVAVLVGGNSGTIPLCAQQEQPAGKEVLERFIKALGGEMMLESMNQFELKGTVSGDARETTFTFLYSDGKYATRLLLDGQVRTRAGFDGQYSWQMIESRGNKLEEPINHELSLELFGPTALALHWARTDRDLKVTGKETVGNRTAWVVEFEAPEGMELVRYFDVESGLLFKSRISASGQATENFFDFAESDEGIKYLSHCRSEVINRQGQRFVRFELDVESIDLQPVLEDAMFELPESLRDTSADGDK